MRLKKFNFTLIQLGNMGLSAFLVPANQDDFVDPKNKKINKSTKQYV